MRFQISNLRPLQLGVLLDQLLQAEARELYRNLGFFAVSFALVDGSFAIFRMADFLAGAESALACRFFDFDFGDGELLTSAGEELGDVLDGVVGFGGRERLGGIAAGRCPAGEPRAAVPT